MPSLRHLALPVLLALVLAGSAPPLLAQGTPSPAAEIAAPAGTPPPGDHAPDAAAAGTGHHVEIPFFSLYNTNFVVVIAFLLFVAVVIYAGVPGTIGTMLDRRAATIRKELDDARRLREEAQALLASYDRRQKEVKEQTDRIVAAARADAAAAAGKAREDLRLAIDRRLKAAEEQIAQAEAAAVREVKNRAAEVAVRVAGEVLAKQMDAARANALIDETIATVRSRLN